MRAMQASFASQAPMSRTHCKIINWTSDGIESDIDLKINLRATYVRTGSNPSWSLVRYVWYKVSVGSYIRWCVNWGHCKSSVDDRGGYKID